MRVRDSGGGAFRGATVCVLIGGLQESVCVLTFLESYTFQKVNSVHSLGVPSGQWWATLGSWRLPQFPDTWPLWLPHTLGAHFFKASRSIAHSSRPRHSLK